jgi:hypothetical protein
MKHVIHLSAIKRARDVKLTKLEERLVVKVI